jgi:hypothetical protein
VQLVYAYRDNGYMSDQTSWKPRKVICTDAPSSGENAAASPGQEHVVKFRQGKRGIAALISEVVATSLLRFGGVRTLRARLVEVSPEFAASYAGSDVAYTVEAGVHFGTVLETEVENGPPPNVDFLADPAEVVALWAFDTWLCTIDRRNHGNTLLIQETDGWHLIASDQSDCFGGSSEFLAGTGFRRYQTKSVQTLQCISQAIYKANPLTCVQAAVDRVKRATAGIGSAVADVPAEWWRETSIDMRHTADALYERSDNVYELMRGDYWKEMASFSESPGGGIVIV